MVSNADPRTTLGLLGERADPAWRTRVEAIAMKGCTVKLHVLLRALPDFLARPGTNEAHHRGQVNTPLTKAEWRDYPQVARQGALPGRLWTELYFQTAVDPTVAPAGVHSMSVFAQYVPYAFAQGNWEDHRASVGRLALESIGRHCRDLGGSVIDYRVLGPPDIEREDGNVRRAHLPRRDLTRPNVEPSARRANPDAGSFSLCQRRGTHPAAA